MLHVANLQAYYGKSHVLHGVDLTVGTRRDRQSAGAKWRGPVDHCQGNHGTG